MLSTVGPKPASPAGPESMRLERREEEFWARMQARTSIALEVASPQPSLEEELYQDVAAAAAVSWSPSAKVPDSSMKEEAMGSAVQA